MQAMGPLPSFPLARCEAMGEGARRAGEGSCFNEEYSRRLEPLSRKSPHPASRLREAEASLRRSKVGHLLPQAGEGECR